MKRWWIKFHSKKIEQRKLRFVRWFHSIYPDRYCWADCVSWAFNPFAINPFKIDDSKSCRLESDGNNTCYCGNWINGRCWDKLNETERAYELDNYNNIPVDSNF